MAKPTKTRARATAPRARRRRALIALGVAGAAVPALWLAIHHIPGFGPALADGARAVVGPGPVAWAEDVAYGIADRLNLASRSDEPPKTYWETPPPAAPAADGAPAPQAPASEGAPAAFQPPFANVAAQGDGSWAAMPDAALPSAPPAMWKTLVHPDPKRSWAAVAIVAIDLSRIDLHVMAGTVEPYNKHVPRDQRPGIIPAAQHNDLLAVFNGGFKATHGHYGMMIEGLSILPPRDIACTVGFFRDGSVRIGTWSDMKAREGELRAYRQAPPCLVEDGDTHKALSFEYNRDWGAAVGGETVIRRSAIGLDASGRTLFYALGDAVTARSLANGLVAAGIRNAAQLDINHSYPRFLQYEKASPNEPPKAKCGLIPELVFTTWEYVSESSPRDFFYLTRKKSAS